MVETDVRVVTDRETSASDPVLRARSGEPGAFDELYATHVGRVYALCLRMTADPARAEELAQDVFVRAWRKLDTFRGESAFASWLHRVTVNVVLDADRRGKRRPAQLSTLPDEALLGGGSDQGVGDPAERLALERALATLPERARMALVLHGIEGYRYDEVAALMGVSIGTVKSHIHRARSLMLERLETT